MKTLYSLSEVADILSVSKETLRRWDKTGKLKPVRMPNSYRKYTLEALREFEPAQFFFNKQEVKEDFVPYREYTSVELFAGAGGLALGLEKAGFHCQLLNEIDHWACETLRVNRPQWNVIESDIASDIVKRSLEGCANIDLLTGGFPCQAFSYAGKKQGLGDTRGTLFYEFAKAVNIVKPKIFIAENVRGLLNHDAGRTLETIVNTFSQLGYKVLTPQVLKAIFYEVPQKRERLFIVGIRDDLDINFEYPNRCQRIYTLRDALRKGVLYDCDVPESLGQTYPKRKKEILSLVPQGGYWRDLPVEIQKEYMLKSFYLGGGKTGMARRISWDEPCLTLTTSPAQKQTERCHPEETRPLQIREYARIQTFPDDWHFAGSMAQIYKQIGNAVPVNLAYHVGKQAVKALNEYEVKQQLRKEVSEKSASQMSLAL